MNGYAMYEVARERVADQQRDARRAGEARAARAARRAQKGAREAIAAPVIPDFAHEMFDVARDAVPAPRQEAGRGRHAGTSH
jgi:hypothetical protein